MSSRYVRTTVRNWLKANPTVPFFDTVNQSQTPADPVWVTIDWGFPTRNVETYCRDTLEEGQFNLVFFGSPGIGDDSLLLVAESAADDLMLKTDTSGRLVLLERGVPMDFRQEEWFGIEVSIQYEYRS